MSCSDVCDVKCDKEKGGIKKTYTSFFCLCACTKPETQPCHYECSENNSHLIAADKLKINFQVPLLSHELCGNWDQTECIQKEKELKRNNNQKNYSQLILKRHFSDNKCPMVSPLYLTGDKNNPAICETTWQTSANTLRLCKWAWCHRPRSGPSKCSPHSCVWISKVPAKPWEPNDKTGCNFLWATKQNATWSRCQDSLDYHDKFFRVQQPKNLF